MPASIDGAVHDRSDNVLLPVPFTKHRAILGQLSDMDLRLLRVFKAVVECRGMAAAELELNIGISTVSRHVKDLETRLGLVLCQRGRSGFALTEEGQRVYDETLRLLSSVDAFRSSIDDIHRRLGGQIEIAIFDKMVTNGEARINEAIALFSATAPGVSLSLQVASIGAIERGIMDGSLHLGIIPEHRNSESFCYVPLFPETMHLYCGRGHALFERNLSDLGEPGDYGFAGLGFHSPNMEASHRAGFVRKATASDQEAVAILILSGQYLGFLPTHYAEYFESRAEMRAICPERFHYKCNFVSVVRRSPQPSRATELFQNCLIEAHRGSSC